MPRGGVVPTTVRVEGLRELLRVTDQLPKDVKRGVRNELRKVAEPIRDDAQQLFLANVSDDSRKTRYGVSVRKVGTISVEQRVKGKDRNPRRRRPKFTDLVWDKSLEPAAARNERAVMDGFNRVLDGLERRWRVG
jgi:hypothetical protein